MNKFYKLSNRKCLWFHANVSTEFWFKVPAIWISDWDIHKFLHLHSMRHMVSDINDGLSDSLAQRCEMLLAVNKSLVLLSSVFWKVVIITTWCYCNWGSYFMYCTGQLRSSMNYQSLIKTKVCGFLGERSNLYSDNQHNRFLTLFTFPCEQVPIL